MQTRNKQAEHSSFLTADYVKRYRDPLPSIVVNDIEDIKQLPISIALTYTVQTRNLCVKDIKTLLEDTKTLNALLEEDTYFDAEADIKMGILSDTETTLAANIYGQFIAANKQPSTYHFPSGHNIDYTLLTNEHSANIPFTTAGIRLKNKIYVRETYLNIMQAYTDIVRPELRKQNITFTNPSSAFIGIIIAHEQAHNQVNGYELGSHEEELAVENEARKLIVERGIPDTSFITLHELELNKKERTVSGSILGHYR